MPIHLGEDNKGYYWQYGNQTKYYFNPRSQKSFEIAYEKANKQAVAIWLSGYREKNKNKLK